MQSSKQSFDGTCKFDAHFDHSFILLKDIIAKITTLLFYNWTPAEDVSVWIWWSYISSQLFNCPGSMNLFCLYFNHIQATTERWLLLGIIGILLGKRDGLHRWHQLLPCGQAICFFFGGELLPGNLSSRELASIWVTKDVAETSKCRSLRNVAANRTIRKISWASALNLQLLIRWFGDKNASTPRHLQNYYGRVIIWTVSRTQSPRAIHHDGQLELAGVLVVLSMSLQMPVQSKCLKAFSSFISSQAHN